MSCCLLLHGQSPHPPAPAAQPRFVVVIDAGHGGADSGARIGDSLLEKDLTLWLAVRLRSALEAHGIAVIATRETDAAPAPFDRAQSANRALAAVCLTLHATATGNGVHLFTSSLSPAAVAPASAAVVNPASPPGFLPWKTAQAAYSQRSVSLSSEINAALAASEVPVTLGRTSMQPLDSFACPAVVVELAPLAAPDHAPGGKAAAVSDAAYQAKIVDALTAAIIHFRDDSPSQRGGQP